MVGHAVTAFGNLSDVHSTPDSAGVFRSGLVFVQGEHANDDHRFPTRRRDVPPSAAVVLHGAGVADRGLVRVLSELAPSPTLPEQVPALVQLDLDTSEIGVLDLAGDLAGTQPPPEIVLLLDEALDAGLDVLVAHAAHDRPGA